MSWGGVRQGAGRPRKNAQNPEFQKMFSETDVKTDETQEENCITTAKTKAVELPPLPKRQAADVVAVSNERAVLTNAQVRMLLQSPHVSNVTRKTVSYTLAYKEMFWRRYCAGEPPEMIFEDSGIDPVVLGNTRVWGLVKTLRSVHSRGLPMTEGRQPTSAELSNDESDIPKPPRSRRSVEPPLGVVTVADIRKLYHQVAYLTQEMEFLKKIMLMGKDGK